MRGKGGGVEHHQPLKPPLPHPSPSRTRVNPCSGRCWKPSVGQREGVFALRAGSQPRVAPAENTHTHSGNIHQKNTYSMAGRSNWLSDPAIGFLKQEETSRVSFLVYIWEVMKRLPVSLSNTSLTGSVISNSSTSLSLIIPKNTSKNCVYKCVSPLTSGWNP